QLGLAPPDTRAAARRIDKDEIVRSLGGDATKDMCSNDRDAGSCCARFKPGQSFAVNIARVNFATVLHLRSKRQRLAARACRQIKHTFAGARAGQERCDLRRLILKFKCTRLEQRMTAK